VDLWADTNVSEEHTSTFWRKYVPPKHWYLPTRPYDITTLKTNIDKKLPVMD
jgi:hypothetical protein